MPIKNVHLSDDDDCSFGEEDENEEEDLLDEKNLISWTGYGKKTPVILFSPGPMIAGQHDTKEKSVGAKYHMTYKLVRTESRLIRGVLGSHGFNESHPNSANFNLMWTGAHLKPYVLRSLFDFQKVNHFPRSYEITRKDRLYKNINRMQQLKGFRHFDFIPQSFMIPAEYQEFCVAFMKDKGPWIVKPFASSRGRGIYLVNHPDQLPMDEQVIISKYIHNPLLIDGFKFDLRIYVTVTSYDPLTIYIYEEGLTRFATVKYDKGSRSIRNQCMHLTNYSVNKKSGDYVRNDDPDVEDYGNKWSLSALLRYLRAIGRDTTVLMMRIEDVIIKTMLSAELPIATACKMFMPHRGNCFELYGFDILIDDSLKPWIVEVNLSPSLACDSPLDLKIKANVIADLFSLVGFVCQDPMTRKSSTRKDYSQRFNRNQRPHSASTSSAATTSRLSAKVSSSASPGVSVNACGLTGEEIRVVRRAKEENNRRGGWVRIFPSPDSWEYYGSYFQFSTNLNVILYQQLYPERASHLNMKSGGGNVVYKTRSYTSSCQSLHSLQKKKMIKPDSALSSALQRSLQYERKLPSAPTSLRIAERVKPPPPPNFTSNSSSDSKQKGSNRELAQGISIHQGKSSGNCHGNNNNNNNDNDNHNDNGADNLSGSGDHRDNNGENKSQQQNKVQRQSSTNSKTSSRNIENKTTKNNEKKEVDHFDMIKLLSKGKTMSKVQARFAFASYLSRVQIRLSKDYVAKDVDDLDATNEQMDLVLRFLKRAAVNLRTSFKILVPSKKLGLAGRRRMLSKQLADFVHIYVKETECLQEQLQDKSKYPTFSSQDKMKDQEFNNFIDNATESQLEEVLTTYTKLNKSASIFLGGGGSGGGGSSGGGGGGSSCGGGGGGDSIPATVSALNKPPPFTNTTAPQSTQKLADLNAQEPQSVNNHNNTADLAMSQPPAVLLRNRKRSEGNFVGNMKNSNYKTMMAYRPTTVDSSKPPAPAPMPPYGLPSHQRQRPYSANTSKSDGGGATRSNGSRPVSAASLKSAQNASAAYGVQTQRPATCQTTTTATTTTTTTFSSVNKDVDAGLKRLASKQKRRQYVPRSTVLTPDDCSHAHCDGGHVIVGQSNGAPPPATTMPTSSLVTQMSRDCSELLPRKDAKNLERTRGDGESWSEGEEVFKSNNDCRINKAAIEYVKQVEEEIQCTDHQHRVAMAHHNITSSRQRLHENVQQPPGSTSAPHSANPADHRLHDNHHHHHHPHHPHHNDNTHHHVPKPPSLARPPGDSRSQHSRERAKVRTVIESRPNNCGQPTGVKLTSMFDLESKLSSMSSTQDDYGSFYESY